MKSGSAPSQCGIIESQKICTGEVQAVFKSECPVLGQAVDFLGARLKPVDRQAKGRKPGRSMAESAFGEPK